jgi:hypothetical protein
MMNPKTETPLTFKAAAKTLPGRPALSTLHRWRLHGIRGVQLETCRVGGRRFTSVEPLERFIAQTTALDDGGTPHPLAACARHTIG